MTTMPLVLIEWEDITTCGGWRDPDQDFSPIRATTVGFLFKKDRRFYYLTPTVADTGRVADTWTIPRGVVTKYSVIRKAVRLLS